MDKGTLVIPSEFRGLPVTVLRYDESFSLSGNATIEKAIVPATIENIDPRFFKTFYRCSNFEVEEGNQNYTSVDGVIFTKDRKKLAAYPSGKTDKEYIVPEGTSRIEEYAFNSCE